MATSSVTNNNVLNGLLGTQQNTSSATKTASEDMESRFLSLFMAQLKNQDPLNPTDANQMTAQLSQISTVSGIEKLNTSMEKLLASYTGSQNMQAAAMIGKTVLVAGNSMTLGDYGAAAGVNLDAAADRVVVTITNAAGKVVDTQELGSMSAGVGSFVWDGKNAAGEAMPAGSYKFSISASAGGQQIRAAALEYGTVNALTMANGGTLLQLSNSKSVTYGDIVQIQG